MKYKILYAFFLKVLRQMDLKTHYSRLELPKVCNFKVPIQPGLFKGTYACHGIELIMLTYEDDRKAKAIKITVVGFLYLLIRLYRCTKQ